MKYLHTMVRVTDLDASLRFYCDALGLREVRRYDNEQGRFTLVFLAAPGDDAAQVELTYNWDPEQYGIGRAFGHLAYQVDDISVIEPTDTGWFSIDPDGDQVTLFTCTPYGINSHRLLVTGHRIAYEEVQDAKAEIDWYMIGSITAVAGLVTWLVIRNRKKRKD